MKAERSAGTYRIPGLSITDHEFSLPLDHAQPQRGTIGVFAREIADIEGQDRPFLVFFQGGPGHEAPRPLSAEEPRWLKRALRDYRVLMLDQRGTRRSTPVGRLPGMSPGQQAQYLKFFRADSIVRDAEHVRRELGVDRWSVLGQSFGGFCVVTYLSLAPAAIAEAFVTGGLPPIATPIDDIYRATYRRVIQRNHRFYERYAADRARVQAIHRHLDETGLTLPSGDRLTSRRFRQLGQMLGMSDGAEKLHYIVELPVDSPASRTMWKPRFPFRGIRFTRFYTKHATATVSAPIGLHSGCCHRNSKTRTFSRARWFIHGCSRSMRHCGTFAKPRSFSPKKRGNRSMMRTACVEIPFQRRPSSIPKICTSSALSRKKRLRSSEA